MDDSKIAIIGYSARLPGAANAEALWEMTSQGRSGLQTTSTAELEQNLDRQLIQDPYFKNIGGGPADFKNFDARFFGFSPKEAGLLCPQIRKSLEYAWLALEHAGYSPDAMTQPVGAYIASSLSSYFTENLSSNFQKASDGEKHQMIFLNESDFLSTRLAYHFNWQGPAFTIKCGCSSSLVAIHEACKALLHYDCDIALSGGIAIKPRYHYGYLYEQDGILSQDGRCCPFSNDASGTVFANGAAFVLLKRYEDALNDGDTIHAIIRASAVTNDGNNKAGYMAPSVSGQTQVMQRVLGYAELAPQDISYVEAHGTGTEIGDPIEFKGLLETYAECEKDSIALRSVKANIGHLDAASGAAALIKVMMDLKNQTISPNFNFKEANPKLDLGAAPFQFSTNAMPWAAKQNGRLAVISSFGIGGTNAALILEEANQSETSMAAANQNAQWFIPLSAKTKDSLWAMKTALSEYLKNTPNISLADLAYTLTLGRSHFEYRLGVLASDQQLLINALDGVTQSAISKTNESSEINVDRELLYQAESLQKQYMQGARINNLNTTLAEFKRISLPGYHFAEETHWIYPNVQENKKIDDVAKWFYLPYWKREQIPAKLPSLHEKQVLLFKENTSFSQTLKAELIARGAVVTTVEPGNSFAQRNADEYVINLESKEDYVHLFSSLEAKGAYPHLVFHAFTLGTLSKDFTPSQYSGLYSLLFLTQASVQGNKEPDFTLFILTNHMANVSGCESVDPNKATLLGIAQVLPKEHEKVRCHLIDLELHTPTSSIVDNVLMELGNPNSSEIALRGLSRYVKDYARTELHESKLGEFKIGQGKNYLVIGGLGNFGLELSEFIGAIHQGKVFLSTRMQFPERCAWNEWITSKPEHSITEKIKALLHIEQKGTQVQVVTLDITDKNSLLHAKQKIEQQFGPLSGVVHAAGIVESGMIQQKEIASLEEVFQAKVYGTQNVCDVFLQEKLDFLFLCSSMNSIIGGLGQIDNTAANAFVDAYAEYCMNQGHTHVLAINWGAVNEARARNYSALPQFAELSREHIKNKMTLHEIFDVYKRLFSTRLGPRVVVSTLDFNQVIENWSRVGSLTSLIQTKVQKRSRHDVTQGNFALPQNALEEEIAMLWQELLGIDQVGLDDDFFDLGGHSLVAIQFIGQLTKRYPIKMHAMSIYEYTSVKEFSAYVGKLLKEANEKESLFVKKELA